MKLPAVLFAGSLIGNAALFATLAFKPALAPPAWRGFFETVGVRAPEPAAKVQPAAPHPAAKPGGDRAETWARLNSGDLRTLVANLRAAGFTTDVIKAIVGSQIDRQFRDRMKQLVGTMTDVPFWKPDPMSSAGGSAQFINSLNQISRERSRAMRDVMNSDLFPGDASAAAAAQKRAFGMLSKEKGDLVQRIVDDYAEMTAQVRSGTQGIILPEDRAKIALLEKEKRADLAAVLTPDELEEYQMRTSTITSRLRMPLTIMDATEQEFRTLYAIQQKYADVLYPGSGGLGITLLTADTMEDRRTAAARAAEEATAALGAARGAEFLRASSNEYQHLYRLAQANGMPAEAATRAYDLRAATAEESMRIMNDRGMNNDDKRTALATLAQNTRSQLIGMLGATAGTAYGKSASWLTQIERGGALTINADGSIRTRMLPPRGMNPALPPRN
jgi:hypothetical protein